MSINNIKLCEYDFLLVYFETLTCIFVKSKIFVGKFNYVLFIISVSAVKGPVLRSGVVMYIYRLHIRDIIHHMNRYFSDINIF